MSISQRVREQWAVPLDQDNYNTYFVTGPWWMAVQSVYAFEHIHYFVLCGE